MVTRDELTSFIETTLGSDLLEKSAQIDENANGVQIHGADQVSKLALGVSISLDFFQESVNAGAQMTITHHGLHLSPKYMYNSRLNQSQQAVLKYVFAHNLTVAGYHYALDAHPEIGNSAALIRELGAKRLEEPYFDGWGWIAEFAKPMSAKTIATNLAEITSHDVFAVYGGKDMVKRIGVVTGGGKPVGSMLHEIYDRGVELHITGEIAESGTSIAKDSGFNYFAAGHYATEVFGVQELGKKLKAHYKDKLEVEFIDIPNII